MCLRAKRSSESGAEVTVKKESIMREENDRVPCEYDAGELISNGFIPVPFAGVCMECMYVGGDLTFTDIEVDAGPCAKLMD